jgi:pullulanase/glycogen debranching enzyme
MSAPSPPTRVPAWRSPGTFAGLAEKARELAALGVTAVQLMPVAEFDETDNPRTNPLTDEPLLNAWGYAPLAFMAPRTAYAATATAAGALREFRDMVRAFHREGLEVILDVVFNHVGEGGRTTPPRSWRGLDRAAYFLLDATGHDVDVTGCGHTFACAQPVATQLILDTLRFWVREMHVDRLPLRSRGDPDARPRRRTARGSAAHPRHVRGPRARRHEADRGGVGRRPVPGRLVPSITDAGPS